MKIQQITENVIKKGFSAEKLPYGYGDLNPILSTDEVKYHYLKHTKGYFDKLNELLKGTVHANKYDDLCSLLQSKVVKLDHKLFNQAAQAQNHTFYWKCLAPASSVGKLSDELLQAINSAFGSLEKFKDQFAEQAADQFGSGWAWLVLKGDKLVIETTPDAETPFSSKSSTSLLCVDLWEHAYTYDPKYVADRKKYLKNIWKIINWTFVSENFNGSK